MLTTDMLLRSADRCSSICTSAQGGPSAVLRRRRASGSAALFRASEPMRRMFSGVWPTAFGFGPRPACSSPRFRTSFLMCRSGGGSRDSRPPPSEYEERQYEDTSAAPAAGRAAGGCPPAPCPRSRTSAATRRTRRRISRRAGRAPPPLARCCASPSPSRYTSVVVCRCRSHRRGNGPASFSVVLGLPALLCCRASARSAVAARRPFPRPAGQPLAPRARGPSWQATSRRSFCRPRPLDLRPAPSAAPSADPRPLEVGAERQLHRGLGPERPPSPSSVP